MSTSGKLGIAALIIVSVTAYMAYLGSASGWQYYLTVGECVRDGSSLVNRPVRVSGRVVAGSIDLAGHRQSATFRIGDEDVELSVYHEGPLPDNFVEQMEVVVEGRIDKLGRLRGDKVLTRCASKYASSPSLAANDLAPPDAEEFRR